ncbi:YiiX family permuted papain-like enzyme [Chitinophaga polysaccharea]|uniref:YiiX family permuted papain-like enzyme n=1 Tax=Chitinophaga TaxID=79328 RepID=UPI001455330B|nr:MULTISPECIES: YiiX family permuted papain-like enzyme [Chitinophaga]NLR57881.1 YiiX family permuted papain-like enzyme [Chitinophaga polysaccharea]NLU93474.1 YiiX family permuted papain-like enzyme [Chitinophaga sp. Ak27]
MIRKAFTSTLILVLAAGSLAAGVWLSGPTPALKAASVNKDIQEGDIIFQVSQSELSTAIQLATHSKYSHCGIIFKRGDGWYVYEALQPVRYTPLQEWIARGKGKHFVQKRLKAAASLLTPSVVGKMKAIGSQYDGKDYDIYFAWSDERMYCSELVWKIYKGATGMEIGTLQALKDFDLHSTAVKQQMEQIYHGHIPLDEKIISPVSMFNSPLLTTVASK